MLVKDIYDKVALLTGFPVYTNATDTPETKIFLLILPTLRDSAGQYFPGLSLPGSFWMPPNLPNAVPYRTISLRR